MFMQLGRSSHGPGIRGLSCAVALGIWIGTATAREARGQTPEASSPVTLDRLLQMSPAEIEAVYRQGTATAIPAGRIRGTAVSRRGPGGRASCRAGAAFLAGEGIRAWPVHGGEPVFRHAAGQGSGIPRSQLARRSAVARA